MGGQIHTLAEVILYREKKNAGKSETISTDSGIYQTLHKQKAGEKGEKKIGKAEKTGSSDPISTSTSLQFG